MKILLEGRVVFSKKHQNPEGGLSRWYVAAAFSVKCYPSLIVWIFIDWFSSMKAERHAKGYSSWSHFVAMLFCQLAQAKSIREICGGLACCTGKMRHLGLKIFRRNPLFLMPMFTVRGRCTGAFLSPAGEVQRHHNGKEEEVQIQEQAAFFGQHHHIALSEHVPLGTVQAGQGGGEAASSAGS
ncbi:MAG: DUF4372 domain-containing protein [Desulfomonilia bacterium]